MGVEIFLKGMRRRVDLVEKGGRKAKPLVLKRSQIGLKRQKQAIEGQRSFCQ